MLDDIREVLISEEEIRKKVAEMGEQISRDFEGKRPLLISVLKGSFVFMADLIRAITIPCDVNFLSLSSYNKGHTSSGVVRIIMDLETDITNRHLIIVEDILDSGLTLSYTMEMLKARNPASLTLCTFLDKPARRRVSVETNYCGFTIPDEFVVGYGLDFADKYRNLPFVGILKPEIYQDK